jgi:type IV secretion system protein VirD4
VLVSGEPPYLLHRVSYLTDPAYAGRFDTNPLHELSHEGMTALPS